MKRSGYLIIFIDVFTYFLYNEMIMKILTTKVKNSKSLLNSFFVIFATASLLHLYMIFPAKTGEAFAANPNLPEKKKTLVCGKISVSPKKHYPKMKPIADYVAERMDDLGITKAGVLIAKNNAQMINYLKRGKVDWLSETAFSSLVLEKEAGAEILVRQWKKGVPEYHTVFFVRKDSGINSLNDLRGKVIALEEPGSTTACFMPRTELMKSNQKLQPLEWVSENPPPDVVGYVFAGKEINISSWVYKGIVSAGAFSNLNWNNKQKMPLAFKKDLKIIHRSKPIPRAAILVRKGLSPVIKSRLKEILLNLHNDSKGKQVLHLYQKTEKFDEIDKKTDACLKEMRGLLHTFFSEQEK